LTISNAQFIRVAEHSPLESRLEIIGAVHLVVGALGALLRVHLLDAKCNLRRCSLKDVIRLWWEKNDVWRKFLGKRWAWAKPWGGKFGLCVQISKEPHSLSRGNKITGPRMHRRRYSQLPLLYQESTE
jgi:hypothetical protein